MTLGLPPLFLNVTHSLIGYACPHARGNLPGRITMHTIQEAEERMEWTDGWDLSL